MSIIKFKTGSGQFCGAEIKTVEVERETEHSVWIKGSRHAKVTDWCVLHDTWELAQHFLMDRAEIRVVAARRQLELANSLLGNVKGMKKPA